MRLKDPSLPKVHLDSVSMSFSKKLSFSNRAVWYAYGTVKYHCWLTLGNLKQVSRFTLFVLIRSSSMVPSHYWKTGKLDLDFKNTVTTNTHATELIRKLDCTRRSGFGPNFLIIILESLIIFHSGTWYTATKKPINCIINGSSRRLREQHRHRFQNRRRKSRILSSKQQRTCEKCWTASIGDPGKWKQED